MRPHSRDGVLRMILVAPSIPPFRKVLLEELGIRCVEIPNAPITQPEKERLQREASIHRKEESLERDLQKYLPDLTSIRYESLVMEVTRESLAISHRLLRDSLAEIREIFAEYEVRPIKMARADSPDMICEAIPDGTDELPAFKRGGAWWAYAFGECEEMPKNDLPNISAMAMPWSFDLAINAELRSSQAVMKSRISREPAVLDDLVREHGGIQFQAILKIEHQPRFYHWIPLISRNSGSWNADTFLEAVDKITADYPTVKGRWIAQIADHRKELSTKQLSHMRAANRRPNVALRLVRTFKSDDPFWSLPYSDQCQMFISECRRLKPFIEFLREPLKIAEL